MWEILLGNVLKQGTVPPQQIQPEKSNNEQIFLYGFAVLILVIVVYFLAKSFK